MNWLNAVYETSRTDLREFNELNFARFDAKIEQRVAEMRADLKVGLAELGAALRIEMTQGTEALKTGLLKWMFGFWATTVLAIAALYVGG